MNSSVISWMSPPAMKNSRLTDEWCDNLMVDSFDEDFEAMLGQDFLNYFSPGRSSSWNYNNTPGMEQTSKMLVPHNNNNITNNIYPDLQDAASSAPILVNFGSHHNPQNIQLQVVMNPVQSNINNPEESVVGPEGILMPLQQQGEPIKVQPAKKKARIRPPSQTYDHIIAERRRREQLSQLFVALSALVPGLKKMDKSSVLEDAIKYLKHLKERVRTLEEKSEKRGIQSVVFIKRTQIFVGEDEEEGSAEEQSCSLEEQPLPEIEARASHDNRMLLKVHCDYKKGILAKLLGKVESLHMIVVNTNCTPFGNVSLDITIIAELEQEFNLTGKQVVRALREVLVPGSA